MRILRLILISSVVVILAGCSVPGNKSANLDSYEEVGELYKYTLGNTEDCLPEIRKADKDKEISPEFSMILSASEFIFSCERVHEGPIKLWGKTFKINGRPLNASYGYALSSGVSLSAILSEKNIARSYSDTSGKFKLRIVKTIPPAEVFAEIPIYEVFAEVKIFPEKRIAVITSIEFSPKEGESLTLILWAQNIGITVNEAFLKFNIMIVNAIHPQ
jgi:hypothetical protein